MMYYKVVYYSTSGIAILLLYKKEMWKNHSCFTTSTSTLRYWYYDQDLNHIWLYYVQNHFFYRDDMVHYTTQNGEEHAQTGEAQQPRATKVPQLPAEEERLQNLRSAILFLVWLQTVLQRAY